MTLDTTAIYALCEPGTRTIRYIGKSNAPARRLSRHLNTSRKLVSHLGRWVSKIFFQGQKPGLIILKEIPACDWEDWERCYIRNARMLGFDLVNSSIGGGADQRGTQSGEKNHNFGKKMSLEAREKISMARRGRKHSPEAREKIGAAHRGKTVSVETRKKIVAGLLDWRLKQNI